MLLPPWLFQASGDKCSVYFVLRKDGREKAGTNETSSVGSLKLGIQLSAQARTRKEVLVADTSHTQLFNNELIEGYLRYLHRMCTFLSIGM